MAVSGMAKVVREVAMRIGAGREMPAPPPTVDAHVSHNALL